MKELGRTVPVHYQEPFRRGYTDWQPTVEDFLTDLRGAREAGAAGWRLHNGDQHDHPNGRPAAPSACETARSCPNSMKWSWRCSENCPEQSNQRPNQNCPRITRIDMDAAP